jgi:hypothetical protein
VFAVDRMPIECGIAGVTTLVADWYGIAVLIFAAGGTAS